MRVVFMMFTSRCSVPGRCRGCPQNCTFSTVFTPSSVSKRKKRAAGPPHLPGPPLPEGEEGEQQEALELAVENRPRMLLFQSPSSPSGRGGPGRVRGLLPFLHESSSPLDRARGAARLRRRGH